MKRLATILAALGIGCVRLSGPEPADLVLRHGSVYSGEPDAARAESLAIRNGKLAYVGPDSGIAPYLGPRTRTVELGGRLVLPAFHDAHVHPLSAGLAMRCPLAGISDRDALEARIRDCAISQRGRAWVEGSGWELPVFAGANPRAELLDALVPDRPALLSSADGHSVWANSRALAAAGVTRDTPDPANGRIERDPHSGEPSGTLREAAMELVARAAPTATAQELEQALGRGLSELARLGVVCAHEANATPAYWDAYLAYAKSGTPGPRVRAALALPANFSSVDPLPALEAARASADGARVRAGAVKLFLDGVIEARTAALLEPYEGGDERGSARLAPDALDALVARLDAAGFQVHMHAIGDRAARIGLDAVERARAAAPARGTRHTIAHLELVAADDLARFAQLGVTPNVQALWAQADPYVTELTIPLIGDERSLELYPIGSLFANADVVAAGSDWPVSSADPLAAIEVGVTRRADDSGPGPGWLPEQRADLAQMLAAYTRGGAWLDGEERERGTLAAGKAADLVVLDRDLFALEPHEISSARVLWTIADGATIWLAARTPLAGAR